MLLGNFSVTRGFLNRKYWFGFIFGVEKRQVELSVWLEMTWASQTEGPKLVACLHFSSLLLQREFFGLFSGGGDNKLLREGFS